jgi:protein-S-isoprenylcysteine O-methyltransferase Ste14
LANRSLLKGIILRFVMALLLLGATFFGAAWSFSYWQAWVYLCIMLASVGTVAIYLYRRDPELLERRLRMRETRQEQKFVVVVSGIFLLATYILPGFDVRFRWSNVPWFIVIIGDVVALLGYTVVALVFRENSYASRVIEVEKGQKVISTGPYSIVRHPMYVGVIIFWTISPLALGSYWAIVPALFIIPLLAARIKDEEKKLLVDLEGYREYVTRVRYRLVPGVW